MAALTPPPAKMADKTAHTEHSIVVRDMSVHTTVEITPTLNSRK